MEKIPLLTVVVPTYGRVTSVHQLLKALEEQTLVPLEIIIVDQNKPGTLDIPVSKVGHIIYHLYQDDPNVSKARNIGFAASNAGYVLFLDDDFLPKPDFCERGLLTLLSNSNVHCLCPQIITSGYKSAENPSTNLKFNATKSSPFLIHMTATHSAAMFFERDYYRATGGFDEHLFSFARAGEDQEFYLRLWKRGMTVWQDQNLYIYHDENVPGGCELRSSGYWKTRQKCIRTWTLRRRIHAEQGGRLKFSDAIGLLRSTVLNRTLIRRPLRDTFHDLALLRQALEESKQFLASVPPYPKVDQIDHLQPYFQSSDSCHMAASA